MRHRQAAITIGAGVFASVAVALAPAHADSVAIPRADETTAASGAFAASPISVDVPAVTANGARRGRGSNAPRLMRSSLPPLTWRDLARPTPLTAEEEALAATATLASRFNPAMALPTKDIWPVEVRYAWHDGSDLKARVVGGDGRVMREYSALTKDRLANNEWNGLPEEDDQGNRVEYHVDAPGDDRADQGVTGWRRRWREIMGGNAATHESPQAGDYQPTQYAHLFWFNRAKGLLAIQYWFYYPYNEWINHHEGDWERINVILRGPSRLTDKAVFQPVGYQFFFHWWTHEPSQVVRIRGEDPREDHVVVYAGGYSRFLLWSGWNSGGSYPLPALFPAVGGGVGRWRPAEDTTKPARFIRPEEFKVVMLPEPERLDVVANPDLGWMRLRFYAGQPRMYKNPLKLNQAVFGEAPQQPARQPGWNAVENPPYWSQTPQFDAGVLRLPGGWRGVMDAPPRAYELAARRVRSR